MINISRALRPVRAVRANMARSGDRKLRERFGELGSAGRKLQNALESMGDSRLKDDPAIVLIEQRRSTWLADRSPLVDGSLGDGGPYDAGNSVGDVCKVSKNPRAALFLYALVREFSPRNVIELGTNIGISGSYIAAGLPQGGKLTTLEVSPYRSRLARSLVSSIAPKRDVNYVNGFFTDTLEETLTALDPIDMAFIDGHHQYHPTIEYFEQIIARSADECVFIFDDIRWSEGMLRAWQQLSQDPRLAITADLQSVGVGIKTQSAGTYRSPPMLSALI